MSPNPSELTHVMKRWFVCERNHDFYKHPLGPMCQLFPVLAAAGRPVEERGMTRGRNTGCRR